MGAGAPLTVTLAEAKKCKEALVGGKALTLGRLLDAGYRVPRGFCVLVTAYERFVRETDLTRKIRMELGRKPLDSMRWEEVWDAALRIRSAFLSAGMPADVTEHIRLAYRRLGAPVAVVRSSAPGEDSALRSHAGLHESLVGIEGEKALLDAVRIVWASLWSDAALLYKRELNMDPGKSGMGVVVQELVTTTPSGVGFGVDPRAPAEDSQIVEAVPGLCEDLVSGNVDPDRWIMKRSSGEIVEWHPGQRSEARAEPLLDRPDLETLHRTLKGVEETFGWFPDVEWTGKAGEITLLQARPVTGPNLRGDDEREWYLSLRPGKTKLNELCQRVTGELIPALEAEGEQLARVPLEELSDVELAAEIQSRKEILGGWRKVYWDEFIPFAHGVRQLGLYYNDAVKPGDPYEFLGLVRNQNLIAGERNDALHRLASVVRGRADLRSVLETAAAAHRGRTPIEWPETDDNNAAAFYRDFDAFLERYMDITYQGEALGRRPEHVARIVLELSAGKTRKKPLETGDAVRMERRLLDAVGPQREVEALDVIRVGRLSWKLRDDDNVLMGRLENQMRRALDAGASRLQSQGRLAKDTEVPEKEIDVVLAALRNPASGEVRLAPANADVPRNKALPDGQTPRQLIGQPAAPGIATGLARIVRRAGDFGSFKRGEIMVCDAIQPTMTHLVPIAGGIVERRGGMLIHGAIIARELGVPCVNGVAGAPDMLKDGDLLTVDGYLGIVTLGPPEFDLEHAAYQHTEE